MQFESAVVQRVTLSMISADLIERTVLPEAETILGLIRRELGPS